MATISPLFHPRDYQLPLLRAFDNGTRRLIHIWHRRCGKDITDLNIVAGEMARRVGNYYYFLPTYSQAKKVIWEGKTKDGTPFLDFFPKSLLAGKPNDSELKIKYKNGSLFQLIGSDNIDSIVGTNPIGCVFSEFPLQDSSAWDFIRPILAENGGWAIFNGTPRGKNHAWKMLQMARDNPAWFSEVLTVKDTNAISEEALQQERQEMPQILFEQEYLCKFIDGASQVFRNHRNSTYPLTTQLPGYGDFKLGVDLAKYQDWTVITPFNLNTFQAYPQDRFNQVDWVTQEGRIEAAYRRFNAEKLTLDSTGLGDPVHDHLQERGLNVDPFKFTATTREQLLRNLAILFENNKIQIPEDEGLLAELDSFTYVLEGGRVKMQVPENMHDDRVMSLGLAVWGIGEPVLFNYYQEEEENVIENAR